MTSELYFPEQRHMLPLTLIRRARLMSDDVDARLETTNGARVTITDVIARGAKPAPYVLVDAAAFFKLRNLDDLDKLMQVSRGDLIDRGQVIAKRRRRKLLSPILGKVIEVAAGKIILQEESENIELEAGMNGTVVETRRGRGAVIETYGAVLQGVWGNGKRSIGTLRIEPTNGIEAIFGDQLDFEYSGAIVVTRRPLRPTTIQVMIDQGFSGIIAPSAEPDMIESILSAPGAVLLTEGFGSQRMSQPVYQFLDDVDGRQALLDGTMPSALDAHRPEVIITVPLGGGDRPGAPLVNISLQIGSTVRLTRGKNAGSAGQVINLPKTPVVMDNGLRVPCARVQLVTGEQVDVPLTNLEVSGR